MATAQRGALRGADLADDHRIKVGGGRIEIAAIRQAASAGTEPRFAEEGSFPPKFAETLPPPLRARFIRARIYDETAIKRFKEHLAQSE